MTDGLVFRHRLSTRLWHWISAISVIVMIMSGLMISNAHPRLYWGQYGANTDAAWLELPRFPGWATIPSTYDLALGRQWHLAFAWIFAFGLLAYLVRALWNGHLRDRIALSRAEVAPRHLWADVRKHARFDFSEVDGRYNVLQRISYSAVLFLLFPLLIFTGLAMSPAIDAALPITQLFGGRQSARSIHFICAAGVALFIAVHVLLVLLSGPFDQMRSMITGWSRRPA